MAGKVGGDGVNQDSPFKSSDLDQMIPIVPSNLDFYDSMIECNLPHCKFNHTEYATNCN